MQSEPISDTCTKRCGENAHFGRDWPFLPLLPIAQQWLAHSGQSKATAVWSIVFCNRFTCMVGPSALLVLEDVAKMCVLGARSLVCHYIAHHQPQLLAHSGQSRATKVWSIVFCNRFNCKVGPSATLCTRRCGQKCVLGMNWLFSLEFMF